MTLRGPLRATALLVGGLCLGGGLGAGFGVGCASAAEPQKPRLVVLIAVDQLRRDRVSAEQPGGLGRLLREGRVFTRGALGHAFSETCPGHAVLLSGRHPAGLGVPANTYTDPASLERRYCVEDRAPDARVLGRAEAKPRDGRSPRNLRADTLGDWMKAQHAGTRVFAVSGKDRAAITMGGQKPDAAYWLDRADGPRFTTSAYYMDSLPDWASRWDAARILGSLPAQWSHASGPVPPGGRPDDYAAESPLFSRTSPHPLRDGAATGALAAGERFYASPYADESTLAFALDLLEQEKLGAGPQTDLLAISLSATDVVGHAYGPGSWESRDALERLDAMLAWLLARLEASLGPAADGGFVVVLSADHGVLQIPEWLARKGESRCPLPPGRVDPGAIAEGLTAEMDRRFGSDEADDRAGAWFAQASSRLTLNRARVARAGVSEQEVLAAAEHWLEARPEIARVWTREEATGGAEPAETARLYANSWDPERAGDLALEVAPDCLIISWEFGTSHGSPHAYDRDVPLVFFGAGVTPGRVDESAFTVDIAPTLADLLRIETPPDLDGRVLPLR